MAAPLPSTPDPELERLHVLRARPGSGMSFLPEAILMRQEAHARLQQGKAAPEHIYTLYPRPKA